MSKDGKIEWNVPAGNWTILRIGYACSGRCNHPASNGGRGFEVDKLSAKAMDIHFEALIGRLCRHLGVSAATDNSTGFNAAHIDSYEVNCQNWTQGLDKTFEKRMGYSITPYLPVFADRSPHLHNVEALVQRRQTASVRAYRPRRNPLRRNRKMTRQEKYSTLRYSNLNRFLV